MTDPKPVSIGVIPKGSIPDTRSYDCPDGDCGISVYRGVIVVWDEDYDQRVLTFIDELSVKVREQLMLVSESKASLRLVWKLVYPTHYQVDDDVEVADDSWLIVDSKVVPKIIQREP